MRPQLRTEYFLAWLVLGHGAGAGAQNTVPLAIESLAESPLSREGRATPLAEQGSLHDALQPPAASRSPERIGKAPPPLFAERPGDSCPSPDARWIEGYWEWDKNRSDFAWVTGIWVVPPPGEFWVNEYWRRDAKGWYRVPGFWSGGGHVQKERRAPEPAPDGTKVGLPLIRPEEPIGMAPGPDFFYIPGEYVPEGGGVVWQPGLWARSQPGWGWIPARWERRATGLVFREGFWARASDTTNPPPRNIPSVAGTILASTPATSGSAPAGMNTRPVAPNNALAFPKGALNRSIGSWAGPADTMSTTGLGVPGAAQLAARAEAGQKPAKGSQSTPGAGNTTQNGAPPQPGDPGAGPQPESPQQPAYASHAPQPAYYYYPAQPVMWNASSVVGLLRSFLP